MRRSKSRPEFSVVMPTYNRAATLKKMLGAWERQTPGDLPFEVVVVDDGSQDETPEVIACWQPSRYSLVGLRQENQGPAMARNYGLAASMGKWVLFTGDDIEPAPDLLKWHIDSHRHLNDDRWAVLGRISWPRELEVTSTMRHVDGVGAQQFSYHFMKDGDEFDYRHFYTSNVSASRRMLDEETAGFSGDFSAAAFEDAEYSYRLCRRGMRIVYQASARAWHHHPYDARSFFKRQVSCGRMAAVLIRKWPQTRRLIGGHQIARSRLRERLIFGAHRRRLREVGECLETVEDCALELASGFDVPATTVVDPFLQKLFHYGYLKGLVTANKSEGVARRLCAFWFTNLVGDGFLSIRHEFEKRGSKADAENLNGLLELTRR